MSVVVITPTIGGTAGTPTTISGATSTTTYEFDVPAGTDLSTVRLDIAAAGADSGADTSTVISAQVSVIFIQ